VHSEGHCSAAFEPSRQVELPVNLSSRNWWSQRTLRPPDEDPERERFGWAATAAQMQLRQAVWSLPGRVHMRTACYPIGLAVPFDFVLPIRPENSGSSSSAMPESGHSRT
jgi:hypothetical protein